MSYSGRYWFENGNVMKREFEAFDPDTTSRAYREAFIPVDQNTRKLLIEYRDDQGEWKKWGEFISVRKQAQSGEKAIVRNNPTSYFEAFIGEWEPSEAEKKKNPNRRDFISAFEWDSRKRGVRILEGYSAGQKEHRILEGFALWNHVTSRVEFHA